MKPKMVIVAGPPGSGKSTAHPIASFDFAGFNADDRAAALNGGSYQGISTEVRRQVAKEFEQFIASQIADGSSFCLETTLRTTVTFDQAQQARKAGFHIEMLYVCAGDFQNCLSRVTTRSFAGGHSAPAEQLRKIYEASLQNLPRAIREMDEIRIYDNSRPGLPPIQVLVAIDGKIEFVAQPIPNWLAGVVNPD